MWSSPTTNKRHLSSNSNNENPKVKKEKDKQEGREESCLNSSFICLVISVTCVSLEHDNGPRSLFQKFNDNSHNMIFQLMSPPNRSG